MGKGSSSSAWVNQQTSIIGKERVDIRVEKNTHIEGAIIAAENGNLKLDTDTLTYKDIYDHDKSENYQANLSGSKSAENAKNSETRTDGEESNPYAGTLDGSYSSHDRQQINRATIGEGEIIIRSDPSAGLEGLNRDLKRAQEITKNEKTSVTVYIDSAAIEEVINKGEGIKGNLKKLVDQYEALKTDLPEDVKQQLEEKVPGLGESAEDNMKEMIRQGVDPDVALDLLNNEQYQQELVSNAELTAKYRENPKQVLEALGIELEEGETVKDVEEKAYKNLQWLSSLMDGEAETDNDGPNGFEHDNNILEGTLMEEPPISMPRKISLMVYLLPPPMECSAGCWIATGGSLRNSSGTRHVPGFRFVGRSFPRQQPHDLRLERLQQQHDFLEFLHRPAVEAIADDANPPRTPCRRQSLAFQIARHVLHH